MWRIAVGLAALFVGAAGCGEDVSGPASGPPAPTETATLIAISPSSVEAQSADLTLTITGTGFSRAAHNGSQAMWLANGSRKALATAVVSSTKLTAVVPALLLAQPVNAKVFVETEDPGGSLPPVSSGYAVFTVVALPLPGALAIVPSSVKAGSADVSLTLTGPGFRGLGHQRSFAFWSVGGRNTRLATTFVDRGQLTAVIPAALLVSPVVAQVFVQTGDEMGDEPLLKSGPVTFTVTS